MSNDLTVPSITPSAASESAGQTKGSVPPPEPKVIMTMPSPAQPNPSLQLDPALGLVVIEFLNDSGAVTDSIPSERQLEAYQRWATTHFGPVPNGMPTMGATPVIPAQREHVVVTGTTNTGEPAVSTVTVRSPAIRH